MAADTDEPMLSRSGTTSAGGKLARRLDIPVSEELEEAVIGMAVMAGVPKAEYVRKVLERHLFGELYIARRFSHQVGVGQWDECRSNGR